MLKYLENKEGKELKFRKSDRYLYIFKKKDLPEEFKVIGSVQLHDLKKEKELSDEEEQKVYESDDDKHDILEYYSKKYLVSESGKGFIKGYVSVQDLDSRYAEENLYIEVRSKCIIPLWFLMTWAGNVISALSLLALVTAATVLAYSAITAPKEGNIKIADTVPYGDEPVELNTPSSEAEVYGEEGEISMNLYSYHEVGKGESLKLTNLSSNDVYLDYVITDRSGENVIYESGKIKPGEADPWIPSEYLSSGEHEVLFTVIPYTMDTDERCISYSSDVTIVVK